MQLLLSLARVLVRKGLKALEPLAEFVPGGSTLLEIAQETWDDYTRWVLRHPAPDNGGPVPPPIPGAVENGLRVELESLARDTPSSMRQKADEVAAQVAADQPAEVRQGVANYLAQVPAMLRRSMRRPSDP